MARLAPLLVALVLSGCATTKLDSTVLFPYVSAGMAILKCDLENVEIESLEALEPSDRLWLDLADTVAQAINSTQPIGLSKTLMAVTLDGCGRKVQIWLRVGLMAEPAGPGGIEGVRNSKGVKSVRKPLRPKFSPSWAN